MKVVKCTKCGGNEFIDESEHVICAYCRTIFVRNEELSSKKKSKISVLSDIEILLRRCREEPDNRKRLAGLILDIDPTNEEARRYLS